MGNSIPTAADHSADTTAVILLDQEACQEFADLMASDFEQLCKGFMTDMTDAVNQIAAFSESQVSEIAPLAHKYKSAAGYLGAFRLRELLVKLESHSLSDNAEACRPLAQQALATTKDTVVKLQDFLDQQRQGR